MISWLDLTRADVPTLIEALLTEVQQTHTYRPELTLTGRRILETKPSDQAAFVMLGMKWLEEHLGPTEPARHWVIYRLIAQLLPHKPPFTEAEVIQLLEWHCRRPDLFVNGQNHLLTIIRNHLTEHALTTVLEQAIRRTIVILEEWRLTEARKTTIKLRNLIGDDSPLLPLNGNDKWAEAVRTDILHWPDKSQLAAWVALLEACALASGSAPTGKWLRSARTQLEVITWPVFKSSVLKWFSLVNLPRDSQPEAIAARYWILNPVLLDADDADVLKGLVWLCAQSNEPEVTRALASLANATYRKIPQHGPRCIKVGNACVWALGHMPGIEGIAQLAILKIRIKGNSIQNAIQKALSAAAARALLSPEEVEELSAPSYGLEGVGQRQVQLGEFQANLVVTGSDEVELHWSRADGKQVKSTPQAVKKEYGEQVKELTQAVKDIRSMLPAQRSRIENLYLQQRKWAFESWCKYYLNHPLVGTLARRLIWKFSQGDRAASGIWYEGQLVDREGRPLDWLTPTTQVELWHPLEVATEVVLGWRAWLAQHQVQQPFKQAHREIYVLTEAERNTQVYSNRFAAHIIRQHQFNSLCAARGWKNQLRLMVDANYSPPLKMLPHWGLRAEFWVEAVGDDYGTDTNNTGTYLYLATDQVRFYNLDAYTNSAHASGGGYYVAAPEDGARHQPLALDTIPPLVLSEIMRDVDLFVGVASVGNDPNWIDGGNNQRHREYWTSYAFGDLSETAKTRRETLTTLLPSLKIKDRCSLTEKFLVVRGTLRTYKIHLGSGNILMEPNDQYLCIVPARGVAAGEGTLRIFLPFEGDAVMAIILSKAFLLAEDHKITDSTITRQINRN